MTEKHEKHEGHIKRDKITFIILLDKEKLDLIGYEFIGIADYI